MKTAIITFRLKANFITMKRLIETTNAFQKKLPYFPGEISNSFCTIIKEVTTDNKKKK